VIEDIDIQDLNIYSYFWKEYGLNKKEVNRMDPKIVQKVMVMEQVQRELKEP